MILSMLPRIVPRYTFLIFQTFLKYWHEVNKLINHGILNYLLRAINKKVVEFMIFESLALSSAQL